MEPPPEARQRATPADARALPTQAEIARWRRSEVALREANSTLHALIDASPVGILILDLAKNVTLWNRAAEQIFGFCAAEVIGQPYPLVPAEEEQSFELLFRRVIAGEGFVAVEARRLRKDGSVVDVSISTAPMRDDGGQVIGAMALLEDISLRKRAERALGEELLRCSTMAAENRRLYDDAQEAVRLREEFLSIASHELRTPLTSLLLAVQSLLQSARAGSLGRMPAEVVVRALETAERQGRQLTNLVDQLLELTRIKAGRLNLDLQDVDLAELVENAVEDLRLPIAHSGCALTVRSERPVVGKWDPVRMTQVVSNLLSNALKYGAGSRVEISVAEEAGTATLVIKDGGIGIPKDRLAHIFRPFERAVSARSYRGLGLGLYIVERIVDAMGGSIRVESELGAGAAFSVQLPCSGPIGPGAPFRGEPR